MLVIYFQAKYAWGESREEWSSLSFMAGVDLKKLVFSLYLFLHATHLYMILE